MKAKRPSGHNHRNLFYAALVIAGLILLGVWFSPHTQNMRNILGISQTRPRRTLPPNDYARGLIYDGLEVDTDGSCKGLFKVKGKYRAGERVLCTHGPDPAPPGVDVRKRVPPMGDTLGTQKKVLGLQVTCDGDGVTGNRVQLIYAQASDTINPLLIGHKDESFMGNGIDIYMRKSAEQTGGSRSVRWVHDSTCVPTVPYVILSPTGDNNFANTVNELKALGPEYNRSDRKYLVLVESQVYCGISTINYDDSLSSTNQNNTGPSYARVDVYYNCGLYEAQHELMHMLGAVQLSAPHSDGSGHCFDDFDVMCYALNAKGEKITAQVICPKFSSINGSTWDQEFLYDCNHDDYFHTNPLSTNYLYSHWNAANNQFLIGANDIGAVPPPTPTPVPLTVSITSPANGATVTAGSTITITADAMSSFAIKSVTFFINYKTQLYQDYSYPYASLWKVPKKPNVSYALSAVVVDSSGNSQGNAITVTSAK